MVVRITTHTRAYQGQDKLLATVDLMDAGIRLWFKSKARAKAAADILTHATSVEQTPEQVRANK